MPYIVSDFPFFGGVGFNLSYCYEIPLGEIEAVEAKRGGETGQEWG
jgi:hypothetical protein